MKSEIKYFIFGSLSDKACKANSSFDLKTSKVLDCTDCTDFDESHKPLQALHRNRQSSTIYECFSQTDVAHAHISSVSGQLTHPIPSSFKKWLWVSLFPITYTGVCLTDFTRQTERCDKRPTACRLPLTSLISFEGSGVTDFFAHLINFTPSCLQSKAGRFINSGDSQKKA